jgi:hypothetical protein
MILSTRPIKEFIFAALFEDMLSFLEFAIAFMFSDFFLDLVFLGLVYDR